MATWTRHAYPGELEAADRLAWYETIGIKDLFASIVQDDSADNGKDIFKTIDSTASSTPLITLRYLKADYTTTNIPVIQNAYVGTNSTSFARTSPTGAQAETGSPIYIDTMVHGDLTLVRFCYELIRNHVIFIFFNDDNIDGNTTSLILGGQLNSWNITSTSWASFYDQIGTTATHRSTISGTYFNETSRGNCSNIIVTPLVMRGCDTGLYLLDGGSTVIPYNTDFVVDNTQFYHIGYGLCLKITT